MATKKLACRMDGNLKVGDTVQVMELVDCNRPTNKQQSYFVRPIGETYSGQTVDNRFTQKIGEGKIVKLTGARQTVNADWTVTVWHTGCVVEIVE